MFSWPKRGGFSGHGGGAACNSAEAPSPASSYPPRSVAATLAERSIARLFTKHIARKDRQAADTLFCAAGAVAGFAAQQAVIEQLRVRGVQPPCDGLTVIQASNGARYLVGDRLDALLFCDRSEGVCVHSIMSGAAIHYGATAAELPDCREIAEHVLRSLGTPEFGIPRLPEWPGSWLLPRTAVQLFWPAASTALTRKPIAWLPVLRPVEPHHWPLLLAKVGVLLMDRMEPSGAAAARALNVFMEAAIPMSRIEAASLNIAVG